MEIKYVNHNMRIKSYNNGIEARKTTLSCIITYGKRACAKGVKFTSLRMFHFPPFMIT